MSLTSATIRQRLLQVTAAQWNLPALPPVPAALTACQWTLRFAI